MCQARPNSLADLWAAMSMLRWLRKLPGLGLSGREARRLVGCDAAGNRYYELKAFGGSSAVVSAVFVLSGCLQCCVCLTSLPSAG